MSCVRFTIPAAVLLVLSLGCNTARVVQTTPEGGVVAIPTNSNRWPCYNREHAEKLIAEKCPDGYEIVSEEKVVVGKQYSTISANNTLPSGSPISPESSRPETEYRITFRARPAAAPRSAATPNSAAITPVSATAPTESLPAHPIPAMAP